jgi:osmotically-inducible protein OsmY
MDTMDRQPNRSADPLQRAYDQRLEREPESGRFAEPRSWWDRTADEVAAWFGNVDAMRRRQRDEAAGDHTGQGPASGLDEDARIVDAISRRMTNDAALDASRVRVACHAGAVTLTGAVTTSADRDHAGHLAAAAPGVSEVRNDLIVG